MTCKTEKFARKTKTTHKRESPSGKCPVCFHIASCSHAKSLIEASKLDKPFIGCYNRIVYEQATIPDQHIHMYNQFIFAQVEKFVASLPTPEGNRGISNSGYRGLLRTEFYAPIVAFAKGHGFLPKELILSIKEEKTKINNKKNLNNNLKNNQNDEDNMMEDDDVSVDLGATIDDDEQLLPNNVNNTSSTNTSSSNTTSTPSTSSNTTNSKSSTVHNKKTSKDLPQANYKKAAIKKARKQPATLSTSNTTSNVNNNAVGYKQTIQIRDASKGERRMLSLREQDFESVEGFQVALRRELILGCGFKFDALKFKFNAAGVKYSTVKKSEMDIIAESVKQRKYDTILFRFGRKQKVILSDEAQLTVQ